MRNKQGLHTMAIAREDAARTVEEKRVQRDELACSESWRKDPVLYISQYSCIHQD